MFLNGLSYACKQTITNKSLPKRKEKIMIFKPNLKAVKLAMLENGYTQTDLMNLTGLSSVTITKLFRGKSLTPKTCKRIADALNKPVTELFTVE